MAPGCRLSLPLRRTVISQPPHHRPLADGRPWGDGRDTFFLSGPGGKESFCFSFKKKWAALRDVGEKVGHLYSEWSPVSVYHCVFGSFSPSFMVHEAFLSSPLTEIINHCNGLLILHTYTHSLSQSLSLWINALWLFFNTLHVQRCLIKELINRLYL